MLNKFIYLADEVVFRTTQRTSEKNSRRFRILFAIFPVRETNSRTRKKNGNSIDVWFLFHSTVDEGENEEKRNGLAPTIYVARATIFK